MKDIECDDSSLEGDLDDLDDMNVHYDFSAWESFRKSISVVKRSTLLVPFGEVCGSDSESEDDHTEPTTLENDSDGTSNDSPEAEECDTTFDFELTDEERYKNAAWRMRITASSVFNWDYIPKSWERHEMDAIIEFLELKPQELAQDESEEQGSRKAINSIFFPQPGDIQSVLLKRGPVLLGGEERELFAFTNGFVLSRIELDTLFNLLFDVKSSDEEPALDQLGERFHAIDTDHSGSVDSSEIQSFFHSMGIALSESSLNKLIRTIDTNSDGTISFEEFKSAMNELRDKLDKDHNQEEKQTSRLWLKVKRAFSNIAVTRKLDLAFLMTDIERIENIGLRHSHESSGHKNKVGLEQLSFNILIKGLAEPLVVTCAKPGHVEPWMEVFRRCITSLRLPSDGPKLLDVSDRSDSGLIRGAGTLPNERVRANRLSKAKWQGSTVDWGFDD